MKALAHLALAVSLASACSSQPTVADSGAVAAPDPAVAAQFARYRQLSAEPTPSSWHADAIWDFVIYDSGGKIENEVSFKVTADPAATCLGGDWRKLVVLRETSPMTSDPAYLLEGRNLLVLLSTDLCDGYDELKGELSAASFSGQHISSGLFGGTDHGKVTGKAATP